MIQDQFAMNAKGHVKLELYDEERGTFFTKEKHNLVVLGANKIVGQAFADPAKTVKANQTDKGNTPLTATADGLYVFDLTHQREEIKTFSIDLTTSNTNKDIVITSDSSLVKEILKVTLAGTDLVIDEDVFLKDPDAGIITFAAVPKGSLSVVFRQLKNAYVEIIPGSEVVTVGGESYQHGKTPSDVNKKYAIDYKLGKVYFQSAKSNVQVDYKFKVKYCLGFMGLGGKPASHPDYKPVTFSQIDKLKTFMENEFVGVRQLVQYPASIGSGDPEVEVFPTKVMAKLDKSEILIGDASATTYALSNTDGKPVTDLISVKDVTDPANIVDVTANVKLDKNASTITFTTGPVAKHQYQVNYKVRDNVDYTIFNMSQSPVLELESVVHEDLNGKLTSFNVGAHKGLVVGEGDVWILNASAGIIQFSTNPSCGVTPDTPGQFTFYYRVNSGTTVQFIADFPKGVPGPILTSNTETLTMYAGQTTYALQYPIAKDSSGKYIISSIKKGSTDLVQGTDYTVSTDGSQLIINVAIATGDKINITYQYLKDTHDIYQVAMFTDQTAGEMFNISGIGPVTKDKNTGMRITWTVTF